MQSTQLPPICPIAIAQQGLAEGQPRPGQLFYDSIEAIVTRELWRATTFPDFGDFVIALPQDGGLGVRSTRIAKRLKFALTGEKPKFIREWTSVLLKIMRPAGRPKTRNNDEGFVPFYTVDTSMNSQDRVLVTLCQGHNDVYDEVCEEKCSIAAGAIKAGLKPSPPPRMHFDLKQVLGMHENVQVNLICDLYNGLALGAKVSFTAHILEREVGTPFAQDWFNKQRNANPPDGPPLISSFV